MKKVIAIVLLAILIVSITGCGDKRGVLDEAKTYDIASEIKSLDIRINAADLKIEYGDKFSVLSNLKNLEVEETNGTLSIKDLTKVKSGKNYYENAMLTVYVPAESLFETINVDNGVGEFKADALTAEKIVVKLGAGDATIGSLMASNYADIECGAGSMTIYDGEINNCDMEVGVGDLNLTTKLTGDCEFEFGVGEYNITLKGNKSDYKLDIEKGIGSITVDGKDVSDFVNSGNGTAKVEISGGVGAINVKFEDLGE